MKLFGHSFVITSIQGKIILAGLGILNLFDKNMYHEYDYRNAFSLFSKYKVPFVDCCIASIPEVKQGMDYYLYDSDFKNFPFYGKLRNRY